MIVFSRKHQPCHSLKSNKDPLFTISEVILIYTPAYSKLAVMLAEQNVLYH